mmetsp:Transcript_89075/g.252547  ORF Transcript_89075/g.252547 Transcript_89075/m.252547 type:complete len:346 (+) Transcript_89075:703-1740(+)
MRDPEAALRARFRRGLDEAPRVRVLAAMLLAVGLAARAQVALVAKTAVPAEGRPALFAPPRAVRAVHRCVAHVAAALADCRELRPQRRNLVPALEDGVVPDGHDAPGDAVEVHRDASPARASDRVCGLVALQRQDVRLEARQAKRVAGVRARRRRSDELVVVADRTSPLPQVQTLAREGRTGHPALHGERDEGARARAVQALAIPRQRVGGAAVAHLQHNAVMTAVRDERRKPLLAIPLRLRAVRAPGARDPGAFPRLEGHDVAAARVGHLGQLGEVLVHAGAAGTRAREGADPEASLRRRHPSHDAHAPVTVPPQALNLSRCDAGRPVIFHRPRVYIFRDGILC